MHPTIKTIADLYALNHQILELTIQGVQEEDQFVRPMGKANSINFIVGHITSMRFAVAGILGHEIAHAESRHVSQSIDRAKMINIGTMAGILAGIFIGAGQGDLGQGIVFGSMAAGQSAILSFTRENETEADEKGLDHLKQTCFSSAGLLNGLLKIRASDWRGIEGIPDYFKTHPGTKLRIAHIESMMAGEKYKSDPHTCSQDFRYNMIKQRVAALYGNASDNEAKLNKLIINDPENIAYLYGMGLTLARKGRKKEAISYLQKAHSKNLFDPMILLEIGRVYLSDGEPDQAKNILQSIENEPVIGTMATYHLGNARLELGELKQAQDDFQKVISIIPTSFPKAYYDLANVLTQQGQTGLSHYYLGLYYSEIYKDKNTLFHLKKALETISEKDKIENAKKIITKINQKKRSVRIN